MKKFVGTVNGEEFTSEKDFIKAALQCLNGDGNYSISTSYTTVSDTDDEDNVEKPDADPVRIDQIHPVDTQYTVPSNKLSELTNDNCYALLDDVREKLTNKVTQKEKLTVTYKEQEEIIKKAQSYQEKLQNNLELLDKEITYWNEVSDVLKRTISNRHFGCDCCDCCSKPIDVESEKQEDDTESTIQAQTKPVTFKELFDTFDNFLKELNFI